MAGAPDASGGGRDRDVAAATCSTPSRPCPTTSATRSGGSRARAAARWRRRAAFVCGMGGSAIGGDLAAAALGDRLTRPICSSAATSCPPGRRPARPCSAPATRARPRRRSPATRRPRRSAPSGWSPPPAGELAELARADGVPVIGLPGRLRSPVAAVGYMFCVAAELAALALAAPRIHTEIDAAASHLGQRFAPLRRGPASWPIGSASAVPVVYGSDLTAPVALPLEDPDQRERQVARLLLGASGGRPQRARRLDRGRDGRLCRRSCSRTATSTRASAAASS